MFIYSAVRHVHLVKLSKLSIIFYGGIDELWVPVTRSGVIIVTILHKLTVWQHSHQKHCHNN